MSRNKGEIDGLPSTYTNPAPHAHSSKSLFEIFDEYGIFTIAIRINPIGAHTTNQAGNPISCLYCLVPVTFLL